ncbi:DUF4265 domain-containing protein [Micromonospora sp. AMSO12t]|uniref:DUF4265 domain-containing protein n=1 Tax=Micromonospora sp. AMSO12t TaxID=2650410 RepID=UPI00124B3E38|nr:DUF4265 domain-containing protein [Micromonospora sp. AMSO12t]KAB1158762.1 DUF4265 domain-containing protein [Micromonospora sp. AMSO12t]
MLNLPDGWVQVWFRMPPGSNATSMGMGAELVAPGQVRLPRAPWGAFDAAKHDILRVERDRDGQWWVKEKVTASGYCAIRIWAPDDNVLEHFEDVVLADFAPLQVSGAGMFGLVVLDVPPTADLPRVRWLLRDGERAGRWTVDELCVTAAWRAAAP